MHVHEGGQQHDCNAMGSLWQVEERQERTKWNGSLTMVQAGLWQRLPYVRQTGSTGTPGTKAPVRNCSMQRPLPVVPSGAMTSMGKRLSFALRVVAGQVRVTDTEHALA